MNIKDFVDVTISHSVTANSSVTGVRPVLFVAYISTSDNNTLANWGLIEGIYTDSDSILEIVSPVQFKGVNPKLFKQTDKLYLEAREFFRSGGVQLRIAVAGTQGDLEKAIKQADDVVNVRVVASGAASIAGVVITNASLSTVVEGINGTEKLVKLGSKIFYVDTPTSSAIPTDFDGAQGVVVHLTNGDTDYISARAMAYVSNQNFRSTNIKPYLYTRFPGLSVLRPTGAISEKNILDAVGMGLIEVNKNFNAYVKITNGVNAVLGGRTTNGLEIVDLQNSIIAEEDLTRLLFNYLIERKPTFSSTTIAEVQNLLTDYLDEVLNSGWLAPTRVEAENVKRATKNGISYSLLTAGEFLEYGYKVAILPFSRQDITERVFKDIYIFMATTKGIKTIKLEGEIL